MTKRINLADDDVRKAISDEIKRRGLTTETVAGTLGISPRTVYYYLSGATSMKSDNLLPILHYLGFELAEKGDEE